jgi:hypothetical protein
MADFGIVSGAFGIAATFTTCVDCFGYIQLGRHFGKDFQTSLTTLNLLRFRLSNWGEAVNVYDDPQLGQPNASPDALKTAKDTLLQILVLFRDSEQTAKKFRLKSSSGEVATYQGHDIGSDLFQFVNQMDELAKKRQKKTGVWKKSTWALYHGENFTKLTDNITKLLDLLEKLFPGSEVQGRIGNEEARALQNEQTIQNLRVLTEQVGILLQEKDTERGSGSHRDGVVVEEILAEEDCKIQTGDVVVEGWTGQSGDHKATNVLVGKMDLKGKVKVLVGANLSDKGFWDN